VTSQRLILACGREQLGKGARGRVLRNAGWQQLEEKRHDARAKERLLRWRV
jgi:hypothetical protein